MATAWGQWTKATGDGATAWGFNTNATSLHTTAWGNDTQAAEENATAWGNETFATHLNSTAWGRSTQAKGRNSTAWGKSTNSPSYAETALGRYNTLYTAVNSNDWDDSDRLFVIGNGTSNSNRNDALSIMKNGDFMINSDALPAYGVNVTQNLLFFDKSKSAFRVGRLDDSPNWGNVGLGSFAFGYNTVASQENSTAWGKRIRSNRGKRYSLGK